MNLDNINKWLSFAANIGVIIGIFFLALELNQNTVISEVDSILSIRQSQQNIQLISLENPEFAAFNVKLLNNDELNPVEARQAIDFALYLRNQSQMAYIQYENGLISEADLLELLAPFRFWITRNEQIASIWEGINSNSGNTEFIKYFNEYVLVND